MYSLFTGSHCIFARFWSLIAFILSLLKKPILPLYGRHYKKDEPINSAVAWLRQNSPQGAKAFPGIKSLPRIQTFPRIDFPDCEMITSNNVSHTYWGLSKLTKRSLPPPLLVLEFKVARQRRQREHQNNRFTKQNFHSAHRVGRIVMTFEGTRIRFVGDALATITVMGSYGKLLFNFQKFWLREGGTRPTLPLSLLRACFKREPSCGNSSLGSPARVCEGSIFFSLTCYL